MKRSSLIKASVCLVAAALAASFFNGFEYVLLVALAALLHEAGHIAAAKALRVPGAGTSALPFGLSLKFDFSGVPYAKEAAVCAAGAAANAVACAVTLLIFRHPGTHAVFFIFTNISLALFNLLPVSPLDGSGILRAVLCIFFEPRCANRAAAWICAIFSAAFFVFTVYIQLRIGANLSLMLISVFLLYNAASTVKNVM